jgi:hypothetical protein
MAMLLTGWPKPDGIRMGGAEKFAGDKSSESGLTFKNVVPDVDDDESVNKFAVGFIIGDGDIDTWRHCHKTFH